MENWNYFLFKKYVQQISIKLRTDPRSEICWSIVASFLYQKIKQDMNVNFVPTIYKNPTGLIVEKKFIFYHKIVELIFFQKEFYEANGATQMICVWTSSFLKVKIPFLPPDHH